MASFVHFGEHYVDDLRKSFPAVSFQVARSLEEQVREAADADVAFGWPSREVVLAARKLRWIHCPGTGIDRITAAPEIADSDVVLTNSRGPHAAPMADHVFAMMLMLTHRGQELREDQRAHQ